MASTFRGIVAHGSSASDMSESVSVSEKIVEDNEDSKIGRQALNIQSQVYLRRQ